MSKTKHKSIRNRYQRDKIVAQKTETCPICNKETKSVLDMHAFKYFECPLCQHLFLDILPKQVDLHNDTSRQKVYSNEEWISKNILTNCFDSFEQRLANRRLEQISPLLENNDNVLILDSKTHYIVKQTQPLVESVLGLSLHSIHYSYNYPNILQGNLSKLKTKPLFSKIFVFDYLEYEYCLFSSLFELSSFLKYGGLMHIEIPTNAKPRENYRGRIHEFTDKSIRCFSHKISINSVVNLYNDYSTISYNKPIEYMSYKDKNNANKN